MTSSGAQTFLDLAADLPADELVAVGDALLRATHLDSQHPRLRAWLAPTACAGVVRARACAPLLSPLAMSRPESLLRYWLVTSPLPDPQPQVAIHDRWGRVVAHGDLGYPEWRVLLEYEGRQHADHEQFGRDVDRYSLMGAGRLARPALRRPAHHRPDRRRGADTTGPAQPRLAAGPG